MPTVLTSVRLPQDLYDYLTVKAESENRTLTNLIVTMLLEHEKLEAKLYTINEIMDVNDLLKLREDCKNGRATIYTEVDSHERKMTITIK